MKLSELKNLIRECIKEEKTKKIRKINTEGLTNPLSVNPTDLQGKIEKARELIQNVLKVPGSDAGTRLKLLSQALEVLTEEINSGGDGDYKLPVRIEFPTLSSTSDARVVDANGKLVKRFNSAGEARRLVDRMNNKLSEDENGLLKEYSQNQGSNFRQTMKQFETNPRYKVYTDFWDKNIQPKLSKTEVNIISDFDNIIKRLDMNTQKTDAVLIKNLREYLLNYTMKQRQAADREQNPGERTVVPTPVAASRPAVA